MPKHIFITKEMLADKLKKVSVRDLANSWLVSESTITRLQKKYGLSRDKNIQLASSKIRKYSISIDTLSQMDNNMSYIFGFLYARGRIYKSNLIIQCPPRKESLEILKLINITFKSSYPIITSKKSVKLVIRDKEFIDKLKQLKVIRENTNILSEPPTVSHIEDYEAGISLSLSMGNTIVSNRNEKIIDLLKDHNATEVAKMMGISVSRVRAIKKKFRLFVQ